MGHKYLFDNFGRLNIQSLAQLQGFTLEQLYQAFKQRLIEELLVPVPGIGFQFSGPVRLIDTTEKKDEA